MKPRYRILIVDDSAHVRASLVKFLGAVERADFDVLEAEDGVEALKLLGSADGDVDCIVTDLTMPRMDGLEVIRHLRKMDRYERMPILFLTAHDDVQKRVDVFRAGATDYVVKPFIPPELEARLLGYLERQAAFETIKEHERALDESVQQARRTQESLLPQKVPNVPGVGLTVWYEPAEHLSGDFYDFYKLSDSRVGVLVADVSGHGISAALVSFLVAGIFKNTASRIDDPVKALKNTSTMVHGKMPHKSYATAVYAVLDPEYGTLTMASAGHPPCLLIRGSTGEITELVAEGTPIGLTTPSRFRLERRVAQLQDGDRILFQTDAVLEVENDRQQALGFQRLKRFIAEKPDLPAPELLEAIYENGLAYANRPHYDDDVTLILMDFRRG